jgi:hypothetical protein
MTTSVYQKLNLHEPVYVRENPEDVHHSWASKKFKYEGIIKNIKHHYKNRTTPMWGKEKSIYISFQNTSAYDNLLLQGSMIMCDLHGTVTNCYISSIVKDASNTITSLKVVIYDDDQTIVPSAVEYTIKADKILSMLISEQGYKIEKLI